MMLGVLFGIVTMIAWGTADFLVARAVRKAKVFDVFVWSQLVSVLVLLLGLFFFDVGALTYVDVLLVVVGGVLSVVSYLAFYKGLEVGKVSVVSPIAACWSLVVVFLCIMFGGEHLTVLKGSGVALAVIGAVLTSFRWRDVKKLKVAKGVRYAVLAMLAWGIYFFFIDVMEGRVGWFLGILLIKVMAVIYAWMYVFVGGKRVNVKNVWRYVAVVGLLEAIAFLFFGLGISMEYSSIVAPVSAAFPMVTVLLAWIVLNEKVDINQKIGIVSVVMGLVLLSL
ncbi:MAG: DMT family transporter [Candidatus Diapherotrites archaeon]|nr:DMT family transporter [Candidatus Diapherotrites archaeon]